MGRNRRNRNVVWAVASQKGGAGKTTAAVNIAAALGERDVSVLVVDLDPQASATAWFGVTDEHAGLLDVFTENQPLEPLVQETVVQHVSLVPASSWLVGVERAVAGQPGAETLLRRAVRRLPARWDLILMDCPPSLGFLTISALVAASEVLVPVEASALGLAGLAALLETVDLIRDRLNDTVSVGAILAGRVDTRTNLARDVVDELRRRFPDVCLQSVIRENVRVREAWSFQQPVMQYAPTSTGAADFRAVAAELLPRLRRTSS